ncbi:MAG: Asp23/Gls24 family envelope stress response protein [Chloroflexota bacterium]|jgi:uncharacterized alkaline shock family protein YloU
MDNAEVVHNGKIVIAPEVLITIAKLSTLSVPGVVRMAAVPGGIDRYLKRGYADGVRIQVVNHTILADLYIVVKGDINVHAVSKAVQEEVTRAMAEMVGMEAKTVNVHVEDVVFAE